MKKYYVHNGTEQQGPFDIDELKTKTINKETPIWYEGLSEWTTAGNVDELIDLIQLSIPPPFGSSSTPPPSIPKKPTEQGIPVHHMSQKKSGIGRVILIVALLLVVVGIGVFVANNASYDSGQGGSYKEKVMSVQEIELSQPAKFLKASGNYNENFWGDRLKVHGVIKNNATVATYKDAEVKVTYYSKTKTVLGSKTYTIYEIFPPHSEKKFELKIDNYKDVNSIGWDVIRAKSQ